MTGLILKLSYNNIGDVNLVGGICGSFFFVKPNIAISANHIMNNETFKPNFGYNHSQCWLLLKHDNLTIIEEINNNMIKNYPENDLSVIKLNNYYTNLPIRNFYTDNIVVGQQCFNEGFIYSVNSMPYIDFRWGTNGGIIDNFNYDNFKRNGVGFIKSILKNYNINGIDIKLNGINCIETSYGGFIGMSGGPLIDKNTNKIIGLMSIGFPSDNEIKTNLIAIDINEIKNKINNN